MNYIFDISKIVIELMYMKYEKYWMITLQKIFLKVTKVFVREFHNNEIVTGKPLDQVALQKLASLTSILQVVNKLSNRPVIGMNKLSIENKLKQFVLRLCTLAGEKIDDLCLRYHSKFITKNLKIEKFLELEQESELLDNIIDVTIKSYFDLNNK